MLLERYFTIYKPYQVLSQFTLPSPASGSTTGKKTLKDIFDLPRDVYPVGRLDYDSEGLLLLTNDASLNHKLLHPDFRHEREYWVQVEGLIHQRALSQLASGCRITIEGKAYTTRPAQAMLLPADAPIHERQPPIRFRKEIPTSWVQLVLTEGKNRQVRKMTAQVGFPTLRLIRHRIEQLVLGDMKPSDMLELTKHEVYSRLAIA